MLLSCASLYPAVLGDSWKKRWKGQAFERNPYKQCERQRWHREETEAGRACRLDWQEKEGVEPHRRSVKPH